MTAQEQERHILLLDEGDEQRSITLDAATYSIGRDHKNAIVLPMKAISREHALLLRVPIPKSSSYRYRIVDGNAQGRPSANGIKVNGKRCRAHDLQKGDVIWFGGLVKAAYLVVHMSLEAFQEFFQADAVDFQSIKQATTNPAATFVDTNFDPKAHGIPAREPAQQLVTAASRVPRPSERLAVLPASVTGGYSADLDQQTALSADAEDHDMNTTILKQ